MLQDPIQDLTPIAALGEFGLIQRLTQDFYTFGQTLVCGVGDDAAVINLSPETSLLISTDTMVEGVHFDLSYVPFKHLGYKAAVCNFSDIYAMNGKPTGITIALSIPKALAVEALDDLYDGIRSACREHQVNLLGGDTTSAKLGSFSITITVLGQVHPDNITFRSGAKPTDLICVSGDVGAAIAGLQILEREKQVYLQNPGVQPDLSEYSYVIGRQLKPNARRDVIELFAQHQTKPSAMIDVSDGIASEIHHLCKAGQHGVLLFQDRLPIDYQTLKVAELCQVPATTWALYGGEDYELLFTIHPSAHDWLRYQEDIAIIGYVTEPEFGIQLQLTDGSRQPFEPLGWNHFRHSK